MSGRGGIDRQICEFRPGCVVVDVTISRILDFTDEITRKTLLSLGPALPPAASNVVKLATRK
jgi:hypothetical protein